MAVIIPVSELKQKAVDDKGNEQTLVSIIMCVYAEPLKQLTAAIESILTQTYRYIEFIIVLDNPNYDQKSVLDAYAQKDDRIILIKNETNLALAASLNKGIIRSHGAYIARMDADDISEPIRIEEQLKFMQSNQVDMCFSWAQFIDVKGMPTKKFTPDPKLFGNLQKTFFTEQFMFVHPTLFATRAYFTKFSYDVELRRAQDYELWLRSIGKGVKIGVVTQILLKYRVLPAVNYAARIKKQSDALMFALAGLSKNTALYRSNPWYWKRRIGHMTQYAVLKILPASLIGVLLGWKDKLGTNDSDSTKEKEKSEGTKNDSD